MPQKLFWGVGTNLLKHRHTVVERSRTEYEKCIGLHPSSWPDHDRCARECRDAQHLGGRQRMDNRWRAVVMNWQPGISASHAVPVGTDSGLWTITAVRAQEVELDHMGRLRKYHVRKVSVVECDMSDVRCLM